MEWQSRSFRIRVQETRAVSAKECPRRLRYSFQTRTLPGALDSTAREQPAG